MAKFKVFDINEFGAVESMIANGLPMATEINFNSTDFFEDYGKIKERSSKLATCATGTGHNCFLKGIVVQMNITAPIYWWAQWDRYHFQDTISSQSTMHRILRMDIREQCNQYTDAAAINLTIKLVKEYHELREKGASSDELSLQFQKIVSSTPRGLCLTRRVTTNYLQLQTMYLQRKNHKLVEWQDFFKMLLPRLIYSEWITKKDRYTNEL